MYEEMSAERNWTDTETRALLYIRQDEDISRQISGTVRDSLLYAEISRLLRAQGIHRTKRQVTTKLKTLKQKFMKIHGHHKTSGHGRVYWNYYDLCKSIWGSSSSSSPESALTLHNTVKLEEPQSTSVEDPRHESRSADIPVSVSPDEETDERTEVLTHPVRKKARKRPVSESVRDAVSLHVQSQREFEERLRQDARDEQKEQRAGLMAMWKEMMEFQGNLLREFIHCPSLSAHPSHLRHALHNQGHASFSSTSYMTPYGSPGAETENESVISHEEDDEEEEEKYIIPAALPVNRVYDSQSKATETVSPPPTQSAGRSDLEMAVLRRQERVLQLQEEYYSLKIKYLKDKMTRDSGQD